MDVHGNGSPTSTATATAAPTPVPFVPSGASPEATRRRGTTPTPPGLARFALAALLLSCSVASPATEIREALDRAAPFEVPAGPATVRVARASFRDVEVAAEGGRARVLAVVDADGTVALGGRSVALGYLGREALELERCARARWCPSGAPLPALAGVVAALAAAPRPEGRRPVAWQIRIERDRAVVGEDAEGPGGARAPRGALDLVSDGGGWRLATPR